MHLITQFLNRPIVIDHEHRTSRLGELDFGALSDLNRNWGDPDVRHVVAHSDRISVQGSLLIGRDSSQSAWAKVRRFGPLINQIGAAVLPSISACAVHFGWGDL